MAKSQRNTQTKKEFHLLAVRVKPRTMQRLLQHCQRKGQAEGRVVSYREVVEQLIETL